MAISRYASDTKIGLGSQLGLAKTTAMLRTALRLGYIKPIRSLISTGNDRLDSLAGAIYGDAKYWWLLAAASNIGWGLQIPPGTIIYVLDMNDVVRYI